MPLQVLRFKPGINRNSTTLSNEGAWFACDKVRFRGGLPEKIGGWAKDTGTVQTEGATAPPQGTMWGVARSLWAWVTLLGQTLTSVGTHLKLYIQESTDGNIYDVTPIRVTFTSPDTDNCFTATDGSAVINVEIAGHNAQTGDFVTFSGATGINNGIDTATIAGTSTSSNTYEGVSQNATSGSGVGAVFTIISDGVGYTLDAITNKGGNYAASDTITISGTALGGVSPANDATITVSTVSSDGTITAALLNAEHQVTYVDSNNFTITLSTSANSAASIGGGTSITAEFQFNTGNEYYSVYSGWGAGSWGGSVIGTPITTLDDALNNSDTTITVNNTTGFTVPTPPATATIIIDSELITYTGTTGTTFTGCTRGTSGTTAASHSSGATVTQVTSAWTGWGLSSSTGGIGVDMRLWSQINFGEYLLANPRGGGIYLWAPSASGTIFNRAQLLSPTNTNTQDGVAYWTTDSSCPTICNIIHVSDQSRFVIAFGCNDIGETDINPMLVRWSDQEDYATWSPSVTNQAGSFSLSSGSEIIGIKPQRQEILVFTDAAVYSMQYLGPPYVWGFQQVGTNISIVGPNAIATATNLTFWMGEDKFYYYDGRVNTLPCPLWQWVFYNINKTQHYQVYASTNEGFDEVWWFYCSEGSENVDRYVVFNYTDKIWYYGTLDRTAWLDTPLRNNPIAVGYAESNTVLYNHESGVDDGSTNPPSAINAYIQSADFDLQDGYQFQYAWRLVPDIKFDGSYAATPEVTFTMMPRDYPGSSYETPEDGDVLSANNYTAVRQYAVQKYTTTVPIRVRGRQMSFKVSSDTVGTQWQLGVPRIDLKPDGRR